MGRGPCEDGGQDRSDPCADQGAQGPREMHGALSPSEAPEGANNCQVLLAFWPPELRENQLL